MKAGTSHHHASWRGTGLFDAAANPAVIPVAMQWNVVSLSEQFVFRTQAQPFDEAIPAVGSTSRYNIFCDASILEAKMAQPLRGAMRLGRALQDRPGKGPVAVRMARARSIAAEPSCHSALVGLATRLHTLYAIDSQ